jgi:hypothetical protein
MVFCVEIHIAERPTMLTTGSTERYYPSWDCHMGMTAGRYVGRPRTSDDITVTKRLCCFPIEGVPGVLLLSHNHNEWSTVKDVLVRWRPGGQDEAELSGVRCAGSQLTH